MTGPGKDQIPFGIRTAGALILIVVVYWVAWVVTAPFGDRAYDWLPGWLGEDQSTSWVPSVLWFGPSVVRVIAHAIGAMFVVGAGAFVWTIVRALASNARRALRPKQKPPPQPDPYSKIWEEWVSAAQTAYEQERGRVEAEQEQKRQHRRNLTKFVPPSERKHRDGFKAFEAKARVIREQAMTSPADAP